MEIAKLWRKKQNVQRPRTAMSQPFQDRDRRSAEFKKRTWGEWESHRVLEFSMAGCTQQWWPILSLVTLS